MLTEEFAEVVRTISRIAEKVQIVTEKQREASKKIEIKLSQTENIVDNEKSFFHKNV